MFQIKWRKINRILHRDIGYFFFGMTIIYAVSGIVMNHKKKGGDASVIVRSQTFEVQAPFNREDVDEGFITEILSTVGEDSYRHYFFPSAGSFMIYLDGGHIAINMENGTGQLTRVRKRPILWELNFLHYNKPKRLWTWFSDIYAGSLILIAITGLFMVKGKNGITFRGGILTIAGILIPLFFLYLYLWGA